MPGLPPGGWKPVRIPRAGRRGRAAGVNRVYPLSGERRPISRNDRHFFWARDGPGRERRFNRRTPEPALPPVAWSRDYFPLRTASIVAVAIGWYVGRAFA